MAKQSVVVAQEKPDRFARENVLSMKPGGTMALDSAIIEKLAMVGLIKVPSDLDAPSVHTTLFISRIAAGFFRPQMIMWKKRST